MERAVRIRPKLAEAHLLLGTAYENTNRLKSLRYFQYFRKYAATDPEFFRKISEVQAKISKLESNNLK